MPEKATNRNKTELRKEPIRIERESTEVRENRRIPGAAVGGLVAALVRNSSSSCGGFWRWRIFGTSWDRGFFETGSRRGLTDFFT